VNRRLIAWSALSLAGIAVFLALGVWQVERRAWKLDLIDQVDRRIHAAPVAMPGPQQWPAINARDDAYRHVRVRGRFIAHKDTLVKAVTALGGGYWVLTPLQTADGATVLVNRGFVAADRGDDIGPPPDEVDVAGLLRVTEPGGAFLRANDPGAGRWFSRDVQAIAKARNLTGAAPFFIDADASSSGPREPIGGLTVVSFPNNHLVYALTWFGLAAMLAGWTCYLAHEEWRSRKNRLDGNGRPVVLADLSGRLP